jgi:hypothetical protein
MKKKTEKIIDKIGIIVMSLTWTLIVVAIVRILIQEINYEWTLLKFAQAVLVFSFIGALMVSASILLIHEIKKVFNLNK